MVVAFSVPVTRIADQTAGQNEVQVFSGDVIYRVLDEVKKRVVELLPTTSETRITGEATVVQMFDIQGKGRSVIKVAGCRVGNGMMQKERKAKVLRKGEVIHDGELQTLRILKKDVQEMKKGLECGLSFAKFDDLRDGDFIQMYEIIEKPGQL